jgi:hypothetical protein
VSTVDHLYSTLHPLQQYNLLPGGAGPGGSSAAGVALPASSTTSADGGDKPYHPDSPLFWLALLVVASVTGIVGASVNVKAGPAKASGKIGK